MWEASWSESEPFPWTCPDLSSIFLQGLTVKHRRDQALPGVAEFAGALARLLDDRSFNFDKIQLD